VTVEERAPEEERAAERESAPAGIVDGIEHEVDPRAMTVSRLVGAATVGMVALIPFIAVTIAWALGGVPTRVYLRLLGGWVVLVGAALLWAYKWPELHHRHLRYLVDDAGVRIRRGVLWRKVISIPTSRVQHTDVSQGPVQRMYELATLTVYTAGTEGASIALEGLEQTTARRLRDHLLPDHEEEDDD